ncbi:MAG: GNAT family N-acetyltransferase [Clostridia bacterium]|nr:GNAT family N-acetyltransferase [Clostridia bacterium]
MRKATENDLAAIRSYLERDIANCIYMYIDIGTYGLSNPNMEVWLEEDGGAPSLVAMRYYNSLQVFSIGDSADVREVSELVRERRFAIVNGRMALLGRIRSGCEDYTLQPGQVYLCNGFLHREIPVAIEPASDGDYAEIAALLCADPVFAHYDPVSLEQQLRERAATGMGRSRVVRKDGRIIAHIATFAEFRGIAVTSGLVVDPAYRDFPYGTILESELFRELLEEGKQVYTFILERKRGLLLKAMGCTLVADYGKMIPVREHD